MNLSDTLAALSEAATEGPWFDIEFGPEVGGAPDFYVSCTWPDFIGVASMDNGLTATATEKKANAAFIVALVNAYRTGQLVPVPSVERVARIIDPAAWKRREEFQAIIAGTAPSYPDDPDKRAMYLRSATRRVDAVIAPSIALATAVIAAMKEGRDGH